MPLRPRPEIDSLKVSAHGGVDYAELGAMGLTAEKIIDFSACCNPYLPSPTVRKALNNIAINQYPDSEY